MITPFGPINLDERKSDELDWLCTKDGIVLVRIIFLNDLVVVTDDAEKKIYAVYTVEYWNLLHSAGRM